MIEQVLEIYPLVMSLATGLIVFSIVVGIYDFFDKPHLRKTKKDKEEPPERPII